jgi:hypothetical protein
MYIHFWWKRLKERDLLENLGINAQMKVKLILKQQEATV